MDDDIKFRMMLTEISNELPRRQISLDMVKLVLDDYIIDKSKLHKAKNAFDVFRQLDNAGTISANDLTLIIAMFKMLGVNTVGEKIKKHGFKYEDVDYRKKFSDYRIQIISIGQQLTTTSNKLTEIAEVFSVPKEYLSNQWVLLQYLQNNPCFTDGRVLNEDTLQEFITMPGDIIDVYRLMLAEISYEFPRRHINLDMVKFVLDDYMIIKAEVANAKNAFDVFRQLDNAGKISEKDITLIVTMLELLGAGSVKKIIEKHGFKYEGVDYTKFTKYRIRIVAIGRKLLDGKITDIANDLNVPEEYSSNQWVLLQYLQTNPCFSGRVLNADTLEEFIKMFNIIETGTVNPPAQEADAKPVGVVSPQAAAPDQVGDPSTPADQDSDSDSMDLT